MHDIHKSGEGDTEMGISLETPLRAVDDGPDTPSDNDNKAPRAKRMRAPRISRAARTPHLRLNVVPFPTPDRREITPEPPAPGEEAMMPEAPPAKEEKMAAEEAPAKPEPSPVPAQRPAQPEVNWGEKALVAWQILLAWLSLLQGRGRTLATVGLSFLAGMLIYAWMGPDEVPAPAPVDTIPAPSPAAPAERAFTPPYTPQPEHGVRQPPAGLTYAPPPGAPQAFTPGGNGVAPEPIYRGSPYGPAPSNGSQTAPPAPTVQYRFPKRDKPGTTQPRIKIQEPAPAYGIVGSPVPTVQPPTPWIFQQPYDAGAYGERPWGNLSDPAAVQPQTVYPASPQVSPYGYYR